MFHFLISFPKKPKIILFEAPNLESQKRKIKQKVESIFKMGKNCNFLNFFVLNEKLSNLNTRYTIQIGRFFKATFLSL